MKTRVWGINNCQFSHKEEVDDKVKTQINIKGWMYKSTICFFNSSQSFLLNADRQESKHIDKFVINLYFIYKHY